jgi:fumarylacetoacetase
MKTLLSSQIPPSSHFSTANLPYGIVSNNSNNTKPYPATRLGDIVINLSLLVSYFPSYFPAITITALFNKATLNDFMAVDKSNRVLFRTGLQHLLLNSSSPLFLDEDQILPFITTHITQVKCHLPCQIGDYTDFYASKQHATNVGIMYRGKDNALQPNYLKLPVGYHGRASSVIPSGIDIVRPKGQLDEGKVYAPCRKLDYELEIGIFIGGSNGNQQFHPISVMDAKDYIFGFVLLNDWSARDVQVFEYVPLGPFTAKNFATSISTWIIPAEAMEPFKCSPFEQQIPTPLDYLQENNNPTPAYDFPLTVSVNNTILGTTNMKYLYWSISQMITHHTCTGCNLQPGDLLGTGTISGVTPDSYGSLLETSWNGTQPIQLMHHQPTSGKSTSDSSSNTTRTFLLDGDEVIMSGCAVLSDGKRVGFGECRGKILPAIQFNNNNNKASKL